ncbi:AEC family transporter [Amycolatopsis thermophila]|uniref:Permease n=1 Tax=Amycolatopsis thermophila TaxID=206084 RepID=A0ABU0F2H2_9PSEU|nr:AEC family transporter [Amycolatopsis thermophila]MDQ0381779.1 putative permease [Amycolatopsis thermophila]
MSGGVLAAFVPIWALTGLGYLLGKFRVLGAGAEAALTKYVFIVAMPAVLFTTMQDTPLTALLNPGVIAFLAGTVVVGAIGFALGKWVFRRKLSEWAVSGMASCYANAGNLGIPVLLQLFGDSAFIIVVILMQTLVLMPSLLALLESDAREPGRSRWRTLLMLPLRTPVIAASMSGVLFRASGLHLPHLAAQPLHLIASAGVGTALLVLGMSLTSGGPPEGAGTRRAEMATVVGLKLVAQPAITLGIGLLLGLPHPVLMIVTVCAGLPTAQNIFIATSQYALDSRFVRDCVLVSTLVSMGSLSLVSWLVGELL